MTIAMAVAAARLHASDFALDATALRCRHCNRSVEPPMTRVHLASPSCRVARDRATAARMGLVRVRPGLAKRLDALGLVRWLATRIDEDEHCARLEPWALAVVARYASSRSALPLEPEARMARLAELSELPPRLIDKEIEAEATAPIDDSSATAGVLRIVREAGDEGVFVSEISTRLADLGGDSVRSAVRRLRLAGKIERPRKGDPYRLARGGA